MSCWKTVAFGVLIFGDSSGVGFGNALAPFLANLRSILLGKHISNVSPGGSLLQ